MKKILLLCLLAPVLLGSCTQESTSPMEGTNYQEIVEYHSATEYLGQTVKLFLEIKNDTLTQIWPVDEAGEPVKSHYYMEKWVKFE